MKNLFKEIILSCKRISGQIIPGILLFYHQNQAFLFFFNIYTKDKVLILSSLIENNKNIVVKNVLIKRGKRNRMFLHISAMVVLAMGALISPIVSESNPFSQNKGDSPLIKASSAANSLEPNDVLQTQASEKPRDKIITYSVQKGDTISTIASKFGVSIDTIKWENNLKSDSITVGDELKILPVTGMAHKVERGDTVYSIAKKYDANAQEIVDFPFNDFANPQTFSLVEGQIVIVPNGVKPEEQPTYVRKTYIATGPVNISAGGFTWPLQGSISQFYSWYHTALDIAAPIGTPIVAAQSGAVSEAYSSGWNYGYGTHIVIAGDNGYSTLYAHMSGLNVGPGDRVTAGKTVVGWIGMTGRTTGPHLHFEIKTGNGFLDPMSLLH